MGDCARLGARRWAAWAGAAFFCIAAIFSLPFKADAQDTAIIGRGDAAVTGFSGARQLGDVPSGLQPLDVTFIDVDGAVLQVFDLTQLGGAPAAQVANAPIKFSATSGEIGQVFAIGLGPAPNTASGAPNIYLGATSAFGLQIVVPDSNGDGRPERVKTGRPNAEWMAGQFGLGKGGTPGSVWQVDGATGAVSLFATIPGNSGPGLGDIVFDPATRQFFVSDLDTGLIHRLDASGALLDTFDHGATGRQAAGLAAVTDDGAKADIKSPAFDSENSATWGFTQPERRVWGLGLRAGRLYYAVAAGPSIWSVSINLDGTFGADPRLEIEVSGTPANHPISDIAFDNADYMYVAERGGIKGSYGYSVFADAKQSVMWRFKREIPNDTATPGIWSPVPDEYAIGFPPDYRNTSGGIALGFGYDKTGAIRPGACDGFVWSTGDSLRDNAAYAAQLAAGGPAIIHGLQGTDRSLIRPDNEPPFAAYFVDYDGVSDDPENQGHAGDVEIWQPCDPKAEFGSYAPGPYLPPSSTPPIAIPPGTTPPEGTPPVGWPEGTFNLRLDKKAVPGACVAGGLGFLCDYILRVTNLGPDAYFGPVVINDKLPAAPAGAVMTFANVPPWLCVAISPTEHQCDFGPTVLLPGDSVDLHVSVDLPVAAPVCHLDNWASMVWPWGFGDADPFDDFAWATATIPAAHCPPPEGTKTNLSIEKYPLAEVCTDKLGVFECEYLVVVRNLGGGTYNGVVKVDETIQAGATATFPQPSWGCPGAAPNYTCTTGPVVLTPGQAVQLHAVVKVPKNLAPDLACQATNKAKIAAALGGTDQNTDPTDDEAEATMILPGEVADCPALPPLSNLKLQKTGPADKCAPTGGDWVCEFKIKVQNFGDAYTSPIQLTDALPFGTPPGATISFTAPAGWTCGGPVLFPNLYVCNSDNPNLLHLESAEIIAKVTVPVASGVSCGVTNNAVITKAPGGTLLNSFAGDDTSSATATFAPVFPFDGSPGICLSPMIVEPEPPLTAPKANETNFTITKAAGPSQATATGQNTTFTITVTNAGPGAYNGPIELRDTLFDGATVEPSNGSWSAPWVCEGQSSSGHPEQGICTHPAVALDPGESVVLTLEIEAPNSFVAPSGSQVKCGYENEVEILKPMGGTAQNTNAGDDTASIDVDFAPFEKHGQTFCGPGLSTPPSPPPPPPPSCPQGWSPTPVPGKCCPAGSAWDGAQCKHDVTPPKLCEPGPNEVRNAQGQCVCKSGFDRDKNGLCLPPPPPPKLCEPGPNEIRNAQGQCVCRDGFARNPNGVCVPPPPPLCEPGPNEIRDAQGHCVCKSGFVREANGRCVPPLNPADICRAKGWTWDRKRCLGPADACKLKGWNWDGRQCLPPLSPPEECRKKGWIWDGKRCLSPADACKSKGGVWDGAKCQPKTNPADECRKRGGVWNGRTCQSPAELCKGKGGVWDGSKCKPKTNAADECKKRGGTWDGKRCVPKTSGPGLSSPGGSPAEQCRKAGTVWDGKQCLGRAEQCRARGGVWDKATKTCKPATLVPR
jgi:uncharacterized repeat protein (TIGR01451 family)